MKNTVKKVLALTLAVVMVALMIPFGALSVVAVEYTKIDSADKFVSYALGRGYNLLGDSKFELSATKQSEVFNREILFSVLTSNNRTPEIVKDEKKTYSYEFSESLQEYIIKQTEKIDWSIGGKAKIKMVTIDLKYNQSNENSASETVIKNTQYAVLTARLTLGSVRMNLNDFQAIYNYALTSEESQNVFDEIFLERVKSLQEDNIGKFVEDYGTHVVTAYNRGGEAVVTYSGDSLSTAITEEDEKGWKIEGGVGVAGIGNISGSYNEEVSNSSSTTDESKRVYKAFKGYGSKNTLHLDDDGKFSENAIDDFFAGITDQEHGLIVDDYFDMVPIWELLQATGDDELIAKAEKIQEYYNDELNSDINEFYDNYVGTTYDENATDDVSEWLYRNPDKVTIITEAEQLALIGATDDGVKDEEGKLIEGYSLDGIYVLANNIDLSAYENWSPIGASPTKAFRGKFYGNYNTIENLKITSPSVYVNEKNESQYYAGLFGYVGEKAVISNLRVEGDIAVTPSADTYIGAVAAYNNGTIQNCYDKVTYNVAYTSIDDLNIPVRNISAEDAENNTIVIGNDVGIRLSDKDKKIVNINNVNIEIEDNDTTSPAFIILENVHITGSSANGTIYNEGSRPVYIISKGTSNSVTGGVNAIAIHAPNSEVCMYGDAELTVVGGDGSDATAAGTKGADGKEAISASHVFVDMSDTLSAYGGSGGKGANGTSYSVAGGHGGDGGKAIICKTMSISNTSNVSAVGGHGGSGGNGGGGDWLNGSGYATLANGAAGGNGGNGGSSVNIDASIKTEANSHLILQYGNGGNGGTGGMGCNSSWSENGIVPDYAGDGGQGGNGGYGYKGGQGGNGGVGGYSFANENGYWSGIVYKKEWQYGESGSGGYGGNGGNSLSTICYRAGSITIEEGIVGSGGVGGAAGERGTKDDEHYPSAGTDRTNTIGYSGTVGITYEGHQYMLFSRGLSWTAAKSACEALGGHLVTITSEEENAFVHTLASGNQIWLGANDVDAEGTFVWVTGESMVYTNWNPGEPNNNNGDGDYMRMFEAGSWDDCPAATNLYYICEWDDYTSVVETTDTPETPLVLSGITCGALGNTGKIKSVNDSSWDKVTVQIAEPVKQVEYYSGDSFNREYVKICDQAGVGINYNYDFNTNCRRYEERRMGYVYIYQDDCARYIPVSITKTVADKIEIANPGTKDFVMNTAFNVDGLQVKVIYNNPNRVPDMIDASDKRISYTEPTLDGIGQKTVTVAYNDELVSNLTATYDITISAVSLIDIEMTKRPDMVMGYKQGDALDTRGIVIRKVMNDGTKPEIDLEDLTFTVNPSMCTAGTSTVTVTYAGYSVTYQITIDAKPDFQHAWNSGQASKPATHTEEGEMLYTCTVDNCGATKTEVIPKIVDHAFGEWTAVDGENHKRVCPCGDEIVLPHEWDTGVITTPATHLAEGEKLYTCKDCDTTRTEIIDRIIEHTYGEWLQHDETQHKHICACEDVKYEDHTYAEGVETLAPTYTEEGSMTYTCTACGYVKTEVLPAIGIEHAPNIVIEADAVVIGQTVDVRILLKNNPGIASMKFALAYDTEVLTLTNITYNTDIGGQAQQPQNLNSPVTLNWINGTADSEGDFLFATLTFTVAPDAVVGNTAKISLTYDENDIYDISETNIEFFVVGGEFAILDYVPGDMNGDNTVNNKDISRMFQYLSGWDIEVNEKALDINGDGIVNNKDLTRLFQYMSGWDVELH